MQHAFTPNLTLEVAYVGNHGSSLTGIRDINQAPVGSGCRQRRFRVYRIRIHRSQQLCADSTVARRPTGRSLPVPLSRQIFQMGNIYRSNYNGLQATLTSRNYHGLSMVAGYTYSHALDNVGANWDFGSGSGLPQKAHNPAPNTRTAISIFGIASRSRSPTLFPARRVSRRCWKDGRFNSIITLAKSAALGPDGLGTDAAGTGALPVSPPANSPIRWNFYRRTPNGLQVGHRSGFRSSRRGDPNMPAAMRSTQALALDGGAAGRRPRARMLFGCYANGQLGHDSSAARAHLAPWAATFSAILASGTSISLWRRIGNSEKRFACCSSAPSSSNFQPSEFRQSRTAGRMVSASTILRWAASVAVVPRRTWRPPIPPSVLADPRSIQLGSEAHFLVRRGSSPGPDSLSVRPFQNWNRSLVLNTGGEPQSNLCLHGESHLRSVFLALASQSVVPSVAALEQRAERTIDEIKTEAVHRAEVGQYPLIGLDPADVKEAFASIHTRDKDEWAAAFMGVADRYMNEAKSLEKTDPTKANADYIRAWRLYSFGRWPIPASPGKQRSYEKAIEAFLAHARFWDPPLEVVKNSVRRQRNHRLPALAEKCEWPCATRAGGQWTGQPKRRFGGELQRDSAVWRWLSRRGWTGHGQNPIKVSENAERMLSRVLDYIATRPEIDKNRVAMHGVSWGAYWATKMAIVESRAPARSERAIAAHRYIFPKRFPDEFACSATGSICSIRSRR